MSKTIQLSDYLKTKNGKKVLSLYKKHRNALAKGLAKKNGMSYVLSDMLFFTLSERVSAAGKFGGVFDFLLFSTISNATPEEVEKNMELWETSDTACDILSSDDELNLRELRYAFDKWSMDENGEWVEED